MWHSYALASAGTWRREPAIFLAVFVSLIGARTAPASAQTVAMYSNVEQGETTRIESLAFYTSRLLSVGWDTITTSSLRPEHVMSSRVLLAPTRAQIYLHVSAKDGTDHVEAKINQTLGRAIVDVGMGANGLFHTGFEYRSSRPFGAGLSYVRDRANRELRGAIWNYWEGANLFAGVKKAGHRVLTIVSKPSEDRFAIRYAHSRGLGDAYRSHELVVGSRSRQGYYGLNLADSQYYQRDTKIVGQDPLTIRNSPLRYISPPTAWMVREFAARLEYVDSGAGRTGEIEIVKYVTASDWIALRYTGASRTTSSVGLTGGRTADLLKIMAGIEYQLQRRRVAGNVVGLLRF